uniref:Uncharacterized protein LOC114348030 n=1 Tax=Diabrotica virgifera virgifera TaxID=50390 RepID=A0A6P7GXK0_DIAVI
MTFYLLGTFFKSYLPNLILRDRHWTVEVLVESLWWSFKEWGPMTNPSKVMHIWGTPLYLGMGIVKFTTSQNQEIKMESLLDTVQLEWSLELADHVLMALRSLKQYGQISVKSPSPPKDGKCHDGHKLSLHLVVTHFNFFLQSQNKGKSLK